METFGRCVMLQTGKGRPPKNDSHGGLMLAGVATDPDLLAVHELLELLDDAMFAALDGDAAAGKRASELWQRATLNLHGELLEESREHYLSFAADALRDAEVDGVRDTGRALASSAVIEMLTT
jgi:hypothetical protein